MLRYYSPREDMILLYINHYITLTYTKPYLLRVEGFRLQVNNVE